MQNTLFYFSIILVSGLAFGRLVKLVKLPNVTGYLLAGLVLGPYVLNVFKEDFVSSLGIVSQVALGFIAFSIGSEFKLSYFKKVGVTPIVIAIFEAIGAAVVVFGALFAFGFDLATCVMLGAIACATAPAATIMVIKQYNAKGSLTQTLLSVVALDDAVALITFGFAVAISKAIVNHVAFSVLSVLTPIYEVVISLVVGALLGVV